MESIQARSYEMIILSFDLDFDTVVVVVEESWRWLGSVQAIQDHNVSIPTPCNNVDHAFSISCLPLVVVVLSLCSTMNDSIMDAISSCGMIECTCCIKMDIIGNDTDHVLE